MILIQFLGGNPLRNLFPLMMFRPERVVHLAAPGDAARRQADLQQTAWEDWQQRLPPERRRPCAFDRIDLPETDPDLAATRSVLDRLADDLQPGLPVVNLTGGSKLISLGAYLFAAERRLPSFYFRLRSRSLHDLGTGPLPPWSPLPALAETLHVSTLLAAHGQDAAGWRADVPPPAWIDFGRRAYPLWKDHHEALDRFCGSVLRPRFRPDGEIPGGPELQRALRLPLGGDGSQAVEAYLEAAAEAGILVPGPGGYRLAVPPDAPRSERRNWTEKLFNLLEGSWLELYCHDLLTRHGRFRDILWSVEPVAPASADYGETDIACIDRRTLLLVVVSCKNSLPSLEHCEAFSRRSTTLGGRCAEAVLCATPFRTDPDVAVRQTQARHLGVRLLCDDAIARVLGGGPARGAV